MNQTMRNKIKNLDELLAAKARLSAQIDIVQAEMNSSAKRTRERFEEFLDDKLSIPKQLGRLFQGGSQNAVQGTAINAIGRMAGVSSWWSGLLSTIAPMVFNFVRDQIQRRKQRRAEAPTDEEPAASKSKPKSKRRKLFKRKSAEPKPDQDLPEA